MAITPLPALDRTSSTFRADTDTFFGTELPDFSTQAESARVEINANTVTASDAADTATAKEILTDADATATAADRVQTGLDRTAASDSEAAAQASAIAASKLNLGNKSSAPSVDNQGDALLAGAVYYDTTLTQWRVWNGSTWVEGITAVAGVSSLNGLTGDVTGIATTADVATDITDERSAAATLTNKTITGTVETKVAIAAAQIDLALGNYFTKSSVGTLTLTLANQATAGSVSAFVLELANGASPAVTFTFNAGSTVKWAAATAPTLTASGTDVLAFFTHDGGTTWRGFVLGLGMA